MSETASTSPPAEAAQQTPDNAEQPTEVDWKAKAREWEKRAKGNADAAKRLAELEESQKSEAEKAADRERVALERATEAERRAVRREIAVDAGLSKEDAELLDSLTDEDAMRRLAGRLAAADKDRRKTNHVAREGTNPRPPADADRTFVRELFGRSS